MYIETRARDQNSICIYKLVHAPTLQLTYAQLPNQYRSIHIALIYDTRSCRNTRTLLSYITCTRASDAYTSQQRERGHRSVLLMYVHLKDTKVHTSCEDAYVETVVYADRLNRGEMWGEETRHAVVVDWLRTRTDGDSWFSAGRVNIERGTKRNLYVSWLAFVTVYIVDASYRHDETIVD